MTLSSLFNKKYKPEIKHLAYLSLALLAVQLVMAFVFYMERISLLDAAFVLVKIINEGVPTIMVGRYGSILTQGWPWLGLQMDLSLKSLMLMYSVSFTFLYFLVGLLLLRIKQYNWIILLASYLLFFYTDSYFYTNNEIHQAVALFCIGAGWFDYLSKHRYSHHYIKVVVAAMIVGLSILTHPLMLPLIFFYLGFNWLSNHWQMKRTDQWVFTGILFLAGIIKYRQSSENWYDSQKLDMVESLTFSDWLMVYERPLFGLFFEGLFVYYQAALLALLLMIYISFQKSLWKILLFAIGTILAHVAMVAVVVDGFTRFYVESQWMIIAFFLWMPILYYFNDLNRSTKNAVAIVFLFSIIWWIISMHSSIGHFSERVEWHVSKLEKWRKKTSKREYFHP